MCQNLLLYQCPEKGTRKGAAHPQAEWVDRRYWQNHLIVAKRLAAEPPRRNDNEKD
jgi:hypothetical protein